MSEARKRFREIVRVLAHYGFGYVVDSKISKIDDSAVSLRKAFEELGTTFIKIGQILSTRPDIMPSSYIEELSKLQDNVYEEKYDDMINVFYQEFHLGLSECFSYFEKKPIASASVAQVYRARLKTGENVIVKIQRPGIKENITMDLSILSKIFSLTKIKFTDALINPKEALNEIKASAELELDFKNEAENIKKFYNFNKNVAFMGCPLVYEKFSSSRVLTMEVIEGIKIDDLLELKKENYDLDDLGRKLALGYFKQIFRDGFFHGDPHPGNLFVKGGKIYYIDFGIMGTLTPSFKEALNDMIMAVAYQNVNKLISVLMSIGIKKGYVDRNALYEDIDYLFASYLSTSLQNIKVSSLLQEIFDTAKRNNIRLPKDFTLLIRGLVIIEGVVVKIAPDIKILDIVVPFVKGNNKFGILEKISLDEMLISGYNFAKDASKLPTKFTELADSIMSGRAKVKLKLDNMEKYTNEINKMANRIVFSLIISSMIIGSSMILNSSIGPKIFGISIIGITGYIFAAIMGIWLLISILKSGKL